ncbi:MAG: DUF1257 domain-containing protein [Pirellulaceae bacterium]|nr:DUF1257 domain-containing protein [Pirellulaceae bacterium]
MSTVIVLTPIIIANWPVITAVVAAAVGTMGFSAVQTTETQKIAGTETTREEIEVDNSDILQNAEGRGEQIVVEREGLRATFSRDTRGTLRVCMEGRGHSKAELRRIGRELVDRVTQQYVYHRVITELKERKMHVVSEEVAEDRTVKIHVRNW